MFLSIGFTNTVSSFVINQNPKETLFKHSSSFSLLNDENTLKLAAEDTDLTTIAKKTQQQQKQKKKQSAMKQPKSQPPVVNPEMMRAKPLVLPDEVLKRNLVFRKYNYKTKSNQVNHLTRPNYSGQSKGVSIDGNNNQVNHNNNRQAFFNGKIEKKKPEEEETKVEVKNPWNRNALFAETAVMEVEPALNFDDTLQFPVLGKN